MKAETVSVVIPVYRSEFGLPELVTRLRAVLRERGAPYEIILVNDGSPDESWAAITRLTAECPEVRGMHLSRNYGQHNALLCGIRAARHGTIITMDDDLQHPPEEIPVLLARLEEGWDVVYGTPLVEQHGWWRDMASVLVKRALNAMLGLPMARHISAFRAFRACLRQAFAEYRGPYVALDPMLSWATTRFSAVPVRHDPRRLGKSNYSLRKLVLLALNMTTAFSTAPLRLASLLGFSTVLLGILLLGFVGGRYLLDGCTVPGFPFLASVIIFFSGVQLLTLGIIGEYLARMHLRLMERPAYTVRDQDPVHVVSTAPPRILPLTARPTTDIDDARWG